MMSNVLDGIDRTRVELMLHELQDVRGNLRTLTGRTSETSQAANA
mgnify:FL=1